MWGYALYSEYTYMLWLCLPGTGTRSLKKHMNWTTCSWTGDKTQRAPGCKTWILPSIKAICLFELFREFLNFELANMWVNPSNRIYTDYSSFGFEKGALIRYIVTYLLHLCVCILYTSVMNYFWFQPIHIRHSIKYRTCSNMWLDLVRVWFVWTVHIPDLRRFYPRCMYRWPTCM